MKNKNHTLLQPNLPINRALSFELMNIVAAVIKQGVMEVHGKEGVEVQLAHLPLTKDAKRAKMR